MKKKILMIATGGTIACMATSDGLTPVLNTRDILSLVPNVSDFCEITATQLFNIDSTNMWHPHWEAIAKTIRDNYDLYDGFVILHGTDTMAYTAAALSYLIQNNRKPIVITGSQKPLGTEVTDAKTNLYDSFLYCAYEKASGTQIVFDGKVISGVRAKKTRSRSFNAFSSINFPYIAIILDGKVIPYYNQKRRGKVRFFDKLDRSVGLFKLTPGANPATLDFICSTSDAVIIESFGTGGIPDGYGIYEIIAKWKKLGKILVTCTQVENEGSNMTVYKVGKAVKEKYGFLESYDMTLEATFAKLSWILAYEKRPAMVKKLFYKPIADDILYKES